MGTLSSAVSMEGAPADAADAAAEFETQSVDMVAQLQRVQLASAVPGEDAKKIDSPKIALSAQRLDPDNAGGKVARGYHIPHVIWFK